MIRIIFFSLLITFSASALAQNTTKPPTIKESVEEVKASAKAIGNLFKKKRKETRDSVVTKEQKIKMDSAVSPTKSEKVLLTDSTIDQKIIDLIVAHVLAEYKKEKPKLTKFEDVGYVNYQLEFAEGIRTSFYFSKLKKDNPSGDLNLDGLEDVVVKVSSNTGGNTDYLDLFIVLKQQVGWKLANVISASDEALKGCKIGSFMPIKIEKGMLIGESDCFTDADPRCCPSLKYKTTLKWENNDLQLFKKVKL